MIVPRLVSVIVPVFNGADTVGDTLQALMAQSNVPPNTEFIMVDNGSTDGTQDIIRKFNVTFLEEEKRGPSAARNRGLKHATGEIIAYLDADTLPTRRWLAEIVQPFVDPNVILAAGRILCYQPQTGAERYIAASGLLEVERTIARKPFPFAPAANMAVRRQAALAIGGWSEDLMTAEDVDFCHRMLAKFSSTIVFQREALLFHRNRTTAERLRKQAWTYGEGAAQMYLRYPDTVQWDVKKTLVLSGRLAARAVMPAILYAASTLRMASQEQLEFSQYHRLWSWWFWRGFFSMYRYGERRAF
ncbi:MAG: glycosyltransferase [Candidatus Eremiobacteraeota bacterium]|nr:glycosyltransferase [Candidatus Eremiobacteraeota bacterium]